MRTARLALVAAGLAAVGFAVPSGAATPAPTSSAPKTLTFTDPSGDGKLPGDDIVKVAYTTTGTTAKVGKKTVYTPKNVVMSIETAAPISTNGYLQYTVQGVIDGCGEFYLGSAPGSELDTISAACPDDDSVDFAAATYEVKGNTITFTVPVDSTFKAGTKIATPSAYVGVVDPITGELGPSFFFVADDSAASDADYTIG